MVGAVVLASVIGGLIYVRHKSTGRVNKQLEKAHALLVRGDMEGLRGASFIYRRLKKKKEARKHALGGQALAHIMLHLEFGIKETEGKSRLLDEARSLLKVPQTSATALGMAAKVGLLLAQGKIKQSLAAADDSVGKHSKSPWVFYMQGRIFLCQGKWEAAANNFKHALTLTNAPKYWIHLALVRLWLSHYRPDKLKPHFTALRTTAHKNPMVTIVSIYKDLLECRQQLSCPCPGLPKKLSHLGDKNTRTWNPLQKAWAKLLIAQVQVCSRNHNDAEKSLRAIQQQPGFHQPDFHELAAATLLSLQRQPNAIVKLRRLKKLYPRRSTTLFLLAQAYLDSDEPEKALAELMTVGNRARTAEWYRLHAEVLIQEGKYSDAVTTVESGLKTAPGSMPLRITKVNALLAAGKKKQAAELANRLYRENPQNIDVLLADGKVLAASDELARAEARFKAALELDRGNPKVHSAYGKLLARKGKWDEAATHLKRAASSQPSAVKSWLATGDLHYKQGRLDAAKSQLKTALSKAPDYPEALIYLAKIHVETGKFQKAVKALKKIPKKQRTPQWDLVYGWLLLRRGQYADADRHIGMAAKKNSPVARQATVLQARSALYQDQLRRMRAILQGKARRWRKHPTVWVAWGRYWLAKRRARKSRRFFNRARRACRRIKCPPRLEAIVRAHMGRAAFLSGSLRSATRQFNRALELDPSSAMVYHLQGACFYEEERESKAFESLRKGLQLDRGYAETHYYLGEIYRGRRQYDKAEKHFKRYLHLRKYGDLAASARQGLSAVR